MRPRTHGESKLQGRKAVGLVLTVAGTLIVGLRLLSGTGDGVVAHAWGIVVPGSGGSTRDGYRIGGRALDCVRTAARLAEQRPPQLVVFSGWSPAGGPSEAEQMLAAWGGPTSSWWPRPAPPARPRT